MRLPASICVVATLSLAASAQAQPAATSPADPDARCLLAMAALTNSSDQNAARLGQAGLIYFAGRIGARDPNFNFARLKVLAKTMTPQGAQTDLQQHCGPLLTTAMQNLQTTLAPAPAPPARTAPAPAPHR